MSAADELRAHMEGTPPEPTIETMRHALAGLLHLADGGLAVSHVDVFGTGPRASANIVLSDGTVMEVERLGELMQPAKIAALVTTYTGVPVTGLKGGEAAQVVALIRRIAEVREATSADDAARELATEYLRLAPVLETDMTDQGERWSAFSCMARSNPAADACEDRSGHSLAVAGLVLADRASGERFIRSGWFQGYVKRELGNLYSPATLTVQMLRVGWRRPNVQGYIKATCPHDRRRLAFRFYIAAAGWEDEE